MSEQGPFGRRNDAPPQPESRLASAGSSPPDHGPPSRSPARPGSSAWVIGVVCVLGLGFVLLTTLRTDGPGPQGAVVGKRLAPFAAPLAASTRRCDGELCNANVALESGEDVRRAACDVTLPDVLNVCALAERGPVVLAFVATRSRDCQRQIDVMERVRRRYPQVQMAAVGVRGDRAALRRAVRDRGWTLPVAHDPNGAVASAYAISICPTVTFAQRGGRVQSTSLELLDERALTTKLDRLVG